MVSGDHANTHLRTDLTQMSANIVAVVVEIVVNKVILQPKMISAKQKCSEKFQLTNESSNSHILKLEVIINKISVLIRRVRE